MKFLRIKNWQKHQHYKERRPPWIKFYVALLDPTDEKEYTALPDAAKLLLHHVWLLASQTDNEIPEKWVNSDRLNLHSFSRSALAALLAMSFVEWSDVASKDASKFPLYVSLDSSSASLDFDSQGESEGGEELFAALWAEYPLRDGRKEARRHFAATVLTSGDAAAIRQALERYKGHLARNPWKQPKSGKTWFNNWRDWTDFEEPKAPLAEGIDVGASAIGEAIGELAVMIDAFKIEHGLRPHRSQEVRRADWESKFAARFGFTTDAWASATDEQCETWLSALQVKA